MDFFTGSHRYEYDQSGNLIRETTSERPHEEVVIDWNPYGKVTSVQTADKDISIDEQYRTTFGYGADQQRWAKRRLTAAPGSGRDATVSTYYVRDAPRYWGWGPPIKATLATYGRERDYDAASGTMLDVKPFTLKQQYLFGSSRLGEVAFDRPLEGVTTPPVSYGQRRYELTNHLGNVTTVFSEYLTDYVDDRGVSFTAPELIGHRDYLAFGLGLERSSAGQMVESYRYGFNGKELDDQGEWGPNQTAYDYGLRIYNPGIARFLSVDPLSPDYPWYTPYQYAGNKPIRFIDLDGLEETEPKAPDKKPVTEPTSGPGFWDVIDYIMRSNSKSEPGFPSWLPLHPSYYSSPSPTFFVSCVAGRWTTLFIRHTILPPHLRPHKNWGRHSQYQLPQVSKGIITRMIFL